jgi:hypothetical protein
MMDKPPLFFLPSSSFAKDCNKTDKPDAGKIPISLFVIFRGYVSFRYTEKRGDS